MFGQIGPTGWKVGKMGGFGKNWDQTFMGIIRGPLVTHIKIGFHIFSSHHLFSRHSPRQPPCEAREFASNSNFSLTDIRFDARLRMTYQCSHNTKH